MSACPGMDEMSCRDCVNNCIFTLAESYNEDDKIAILPGKNLREIAKVADFFGVTLTQAIGARKAFLRKEFYYYLDADVDFNTWQVICKPALIEISGYFTKLSKDMYFRNRKIDKDDITPEMIQNARGYPVAGLLEWTNGRSLAWCHEDHTPSLYVAKRIGKVHCPVCNKYFDAIDIVKNRDGVSFPEAVKRLCS